MPDQPTCRHCGVYMHLHPHLRCDKPKVARWWHEHAIRRHIAVAIWWRMPSRWRWAYCNWISGKRHHWCEVVDAVIKADDVAGHSDYQGSNGCACDFPLPRDARPEPPVCYYCNPPEESA